VLPSQQLYTTAVAGADLRETGDAVCGTPVISEQNTFQGSTAARQMHMPGGFAGFVVWPLA